VQRHLAIGADTDCFENIFFVFGRPGNCSSARSLFSFSFHCQHVSGQVVADDNEGELSSFDNVNADVSNVNGYNCVGT
jgi:hypothetical protein